VPPRSPDERCPAGRFPGHHEITTDRDAASCLFCGAVFTAPDRNAVLDPHVSVPMGKPPRPRTLTVRGCLPIVVTLLIVAGFLSVVQAEQPAAVEPACDPGAVMNHRLDELGRIGFVWAIESLDGPGPGGVTLIDEHAVKTHRTPRARWWSAS
jgi:hypothetical protein